MIEALSALPMELSMTTNCIRVNDMLPEIVKANFNSINIILDTLQRNKFVQITRRDYFERVRNNIDILLGQHIHTKINVVVMKGLNDDEILDFVELTRSLPVEVRFIEFMHFSGNRWTSNQVVTYQELLDKKIGRAHVCTPVTNA